MDPARLSAHPVSLELGTVADDADLRALLRSTPMEGPVRLTLRREPDFFRALAVEGPFHQVLVARDPGEGRVVAMGTRSVRDRYVDGVAMPVGYLSALRVHPAYRGGPVLARGYRFLRELHHDGRTPWYLSSIATGNSTARRILTSARAGLPTYFPLGPFVTWVIPRRRRAPRGMPYDLRALTPADLPQLLAVITRGARRRQFIPCYGTEDFGAASTTFANLPLSSIYGAWRGGRLVATLAAWDQRDFRQMFVEGYTGPLRRARHAYNAWAWLRGRPRFPAPGGCLPLLAGALPFADDEPAAFPLLLDHVAARLPSGAEAFLVGLSTRDPLTGTVRRRAIAHYTTELFAVCWEPEQVRPDRFQSCVPYLELGCL